MHAIKFPFSQLHLFRLFRIMFGLFLFCHFFFLFGSLEVLFSEKFLALNSGGIFNILSYTSGGATINLINSVACLLSIFICFGFHRRIASLILLYVHSIYLHKNPMILNVSYDYLGWLLLALILIPNENLSPNFTKKKSWQIPRYIMVSGWLIFGLGYTLNGILKIQSSVWADGTALSLIIPNDRLLSSEFIRTILMSLPAAALKGLTWTTAYAELLCLPLILFKRGRVVIWTVILILHFNALIIFKIKDLSLIMIFFSLFIGMFFSPPSSPEWISSAENEKANS